MLDFILLMFCIVFISLNVFFKKMIIQHVTLEEYMIGISICVPIIISLYFVIRFCIIKDKKLEVDIFNKVKVDSRLFLLFISTAFITVCGNLILVKLLKKKNVSYLVPHITGISLVFSIMIAYFIFQEIIDWKMLLGIVLIIIGVFVINCSKNIKN